MSTRKSKDKPNSSRTSKLIEVDPTPHAPPTERRETTRGPPTTRGPDDRQTLRRGESDDYYNPAVTLGPSTGPSGGAAYVESPTHYNGGAPAQQYPSHMGGGSYGGSSGGANTGHQAGGGHNGAGYSGGSGGHPGHGGYTGGGPIYHAGYGQVKPAHYSSHSGTAFPTQGERPSEQHQGYHVPPPGGYGGGGPPPLQHSVSYGGGPIPTSSIYGGPPTLQNSNAYGGPQAQNAFGSSGYQHPVPTQGAKPPRRDSTSSSSSSSYVDISRYAPVPPLKKNPLGALRTFFTAPSESRRRVIRRKSSRTLRAQRKEGKKISGRRSSSSEGSSVDSDLAYGTGYLRRRKSKRRGSRGSRSPRRYGQGHSRSPRRYGSPGRDGLNGPDGRNRENLRPAGGVPLPGLHHSSTMPGSFPIEAGVVAAGSAAIAAGLSHQSSSSPSKPPKPSKQSKKDAETEILKLGEDLHNLAKKQNRYDLEEAAKRGKYNVVRDDHRLGRHGYGPKSFSGGASPARGIAPSRAAKGMKKPKDDDGWETSDSDGTSSSESVDDALGYGDAGTYEWKWREPSHLPRQNSRDQKDQHYPHPPTRKSTIVDPKLFGPQNSLQGVVMRPVGFGEVDDLRSDGATPLNPPTVKQTGYFRSPVPSPRPVEIQDMENLRPKATDGKRRAPSPRGGKEGELQHVFPIPTSDPSQFDITRGSVSTPSHPSSVMAEKRPSFHARTDSLPLRQPKPMSPVRREVYDSPEKKIQKKDKNESSRSNDLALGGLAGAALAAAVAAGMSSPEIERYKTKDKGRARADRPEREDRKIDSQRMFKDDMARRNGRRPEGVPDRRDSYGFSGAPTSAISPMSTKEGKIDPFQYQVDKWEDEQSTRGTDYDPKGKKPAAHERIAARAAGNGRDTGSSTPRRYQEEIARDRQREQEYQEQLYSSSPEVLRRGDGGANRLLDRTDSEREKSRAEVRPLHERIASRAAESNPDTGRSSPTQKRLDEEAERRIAEVLAKWAPKRAADIKARQVELAEMDNLITGESIERGSTPAPVIEMVERRPKWARDQSPMPPSRAPDAYSPEVTRDKGKGREESSRWQPESPDMKRVREDEGSNYAPPMVRTASDADHRYAQMNDDYFGSKPSASYSPELRTKERRRGRSRTRSPSEEERGRGRTRSRSVARERSPNMEPEIREARSPLNKSARDGSPVDKYDVRHDRDRKYTADDAEHMMEEAEHFTAPISEAAIAVAIAAVHRDEDRHRGDFHSEYDSEGREVPRDPVQEEANRVYRETVLARKIAAQRDKSGRSSPRVVTPPAMEHSEDAHRRKEGWESPNADFKLDHVMTPIELPLFSPVALRKSFSLPEHFDESAPFDPSMLGLDRPILNLVKPTPKPEEQVVKRKEPRSRSQSRERKIETSRGVDDDDKPSYSKPYTPSDIEDEPLNTFTEIPSISEQEKDDKDEKSVSWGADDIQHYVPITPYDEPRNPHEAGSIPSSPETTRATTGGLPHSRSFEHHKDKEESDREDEKRDKGKGKGKEVKETPEKRPKPKSLWSKFTPDLASQILQREELAYNLANASTIGFADGDEGREVSRDEVEELALARGTLFKDPELEKGEAFEYRGIFVEPEPPRKHRSKKHRKSDVVVDQGEEERGRDHRDRTISPPPVGPKPSNSDVGGARMPGAFSDDEVAFARPRGISAPASDVSTVIYHQPSELSESAGIATGFNTAVHSMIGGEDERSLPLDLARGVSDESFVDVDRPAGSSNESFVVVEEDKVPEEIKENETMVVTVEDPGHHTESFAVVDHPSSIPSEETQPLIVDRPAGLERSMTEDTEGFVTPLETPGAEVMTPFDASIEDISAPQIEDASAPLGAVDTSFTPEIGETTREIFDALAQDASMMPLPESSKDTSTETETSSSSKKSKKKKKGKKASTPLDEKEESLPLGDKEMSEETKHECRIAEVLLEHAVPVPENAAFPTTKEIQEETGHAPTTSEGESKEIVVDLATPAVEDDGKDKSLAGEDSKTEPLPPPAEVASEITEPSAPLDDSATRNDHDSISKSIEPVSGTDVETGGTRELGHSSSGLALVDSTRDVDEKKKKKTSGINSDIAAVALAGTVAAVAGIANRIMGDSKEPEVEKNRKEVKDVKEENAEFVEEEMPTGLNAKQRKAWKKKQDKARDAWESERASASQNASGEQTPAVVADEGKEVGEKKKAKEEDINKEIDETPLQDAVEVVEQTPEAITDRGEAAEYYNPATSTSDVVPVPATTDIVDATATEEVVEKSTNVVAEDIPATAETVSSAPTTIVVDESTSAPEAGVEMVFDKAFNMDVPAGLNKKQKREWVKAKKAADMEAETKRFLESVKGGKGYISPENPMPIDAERMREIFGGAKPGEEGERIGRAVGGPEEVNEGINEEVGEPAPSTEDPATDVIETSEPKLEAGVKNFEEGVKAVQDTVEAAETPLPASADVSTEASGTDMTTEEEMPKGFNKKQKKAWEKKQKEIKIQRELDAAAAVAAAVSVLSEPVVEEQTREVVEPAAEEVVIDEAAKEAIEPASDIVMVEESKEISEPALEIVSEEPATTVVEASEPQPEQGISNLDDAVKAIHENVEGTTTPSMEGVETAGQSSSDVQTEEDMPKGLNKKQKKAWQKKQEEARIQRELDTAAAEAAKVESEAAIAPVEVIEATSKEFSEPAVETVPEPVVLEEVSKETAEPASSEPIVVEESNEIFVHTPEPVVSDKPATIIVGASEPQPEAPVENFEDAVRAIHDATATPVDTPNEVLETAGQSSSDILTEEEMPKGLNKKQKKAWQKKQDEARIQRELDAAAAQVAQTEAEATIVPVEVVDEQSKEIVEPGNEISTEPAAAIEEQIKEVVESSPEAVVESVVVEEQPREVLESISEPVVIDRPATEAVEAPLETPGESGSQTPAILEGEPQPPKKMNKREKKAWDKAQREAKALAEAEAEATALAAASEPIPAPVAEFTVPEVLPTPVFEDESGAFATAPMATPIPTPLEEPAQADTPPEADTVSLSIEEAVALAASDPEAAPGDVSLSIEDAAALAGDSPTRKLNKKEKKALEKAQRAKELEMESSTATETEGRVAVPIDAFKDIQDIQQNPDAGDVVEDEWGTSALATPMEVPSMITPDVGTPLETPAEETEVSLGGKKKKKKKGKGKVVEIESEPVTPATEPEAVQQFIEPATETIREIDPVPETVIDPVAETLALLGGISRSRAIPATDVRQSVESTEQQMESPTDDDDAFHSAAEDRGRSETPTGTIGTIDDDEFKDFHSTNGDDFQLPTSGHHAEPEIAETVPQIAEDTKEPEVATEAEFAPVGGKKKKKKKKGKGATEDSGSGEVSGTVTPGGETEKESFLANAGTLGAGVGSATVLEESRDINSGIGANADAAGRWESQPSDVMRMVGEDKVGEKEKEGTVVGHDDGGDVYRNVTFGRRKEEDPVEETMKLLEGIDHQPKLMDILNDPEIREREVLPSVDPQFGDLLPLPPRDSPPNEEVDGGALATSLPLTPVVEQHAVFQPMTLGGIQEQNEPRENKEEVFTIDPEIQERKIHPSVDPQYGDLLPLPPSQPGSPARSLEEEILTTQLPDSPPESPAVARLSLDSSSPQTPKKKDTTHLMRSPSISAVPLKFLLGNRSTPSSPVVGKGSPVLTSPTRSEFTERPKSRHSWDSSKGLQPLQLLERRHSRGSSLAEFDSRALAPLLEGAKPQHDRSPERVIASDDHAVLTDEGNTSTPAEAFATAVSEKQGQDEYFGTTEGQADVPAVIEDIQAPLGAPSGNIADTTAVAEGAQILPQPLTETPIETSTDSATESAVFTEEEMPKGFSAKARKAWKAKQRKAKEIFDAEQLARKSATVETETEPETVISTLPADASSVLETDSGEQSTKEVLVDQPQPAVEEVVMEPVVAEPLAEVPAESDAIVDTLEPSIARNISLTESALATPLEISTELPFAEQEMPQGLNAKARKAWKQKQDKAREAFEAEQAQKIPTAETKTEQEVVARNDTVEASLEAPYPEIVKEKSNDVNDIPHAFPETAIVVDDTPLDAPTAIIPNESANITDDFEPSVARNITLPESGTATPLHSSTESPFVEEEMPAGLNTKQRKAWKKKQEKAKADWESAAASSSAPENGFQTPAVQDTQQIVPEPVIETPIIEETAVAVENIVEPITVSEPLEASKDIHAEVVSQPAAVDEPQTALEDVAKDTPLPETPLDAPSAVTQPAVFIEEEMPAGLNAKARKAWKKKQDKARKEFESASASTSGGWTDSGAQTPAADVVEKHIVEETIETHIPETAPIEDVVSAADTPSSGTISDFDAAVRALHDRESEPIEPAEEPAVVEAPIEIIAETKVPAILEGIQTEAPVLETPFEPPMFSIEPAPFVEEEMPTGLNAKQRKAWTKKQQKAKEDWESGLMSSSAVDSTMQTPAVVEALTESDTAASVVVESQEGSRAFDVSASEEQRQLPAHEIGELPIIQEQPLAATTDLESVLQQIPAVEQIPEPSAMDITSAPAAVEPAVLEDETETPLKDASDEPPPAPQEDMLVPETPKLEIGGFIQTPLVEIGEPTLPEQPSFVEEEMPSGLNTKARKAWKKKQDKARADFEAASGSASTGDSGFQIPAAQVLPSKVVEERLKDVTEPSMVTDTPPIEETREFSEPAPVFEDIVPESQPAEIAPEVPSEAPVVIEEPIPAVEIVQPLATAEYVEEEMPTVLNAKQRKAWKKKQQKAKEDWESGLTSTSAGDSGLQTPAVQEAPTIGIDEIAKVTDESESGPSATGFSTDVPTEEQPISVTEPIQSTIDTTIYDVSDPAEQPTMVQPETIAVPESVEQIPAPVIPPYEGGGLAAEYFEGMGTPPGPLSPTVRAAALARNLLSEQPEQALSLKEDLPFTGDIKKSKTNKKKSLVVDDEQVSESQGEKGDVDSSAVETTTPKKSKKKKGKGKDIAVDETAAEVLSPVEEKGHAGADDLDDDAPPKKIAAPTMLPGKVEDAFSRPQSPMATTDGAPDPAKDKKKKKKKGKKGAVVEEIETPVTTEPSLDSIAIPTKANPEALFVSEADPTLQDVSAELESAKAMKEPVSAIPPVESDANDSPSTPDAVRETLALLGGISRTREPVVRIIAQPDLPAEVIEETVDQPMPVVEETPVPKVPEALREVMAEPWPIGETGPIVDAAPAQDTTTGISAEIVQVDFSQETPFLETPIESSSGSAAEWVEEDVPKELNAKARKAWKAKQKKAKEIFEAEQLASKSAVIETETEPEVAKKVMMTESVLETPSDQMDVPAEVSKEVETAEQPQIIVEEPVTGPIAPEPLAEIPAESAALVDDLEPSIARNVPLPDSSGSATPVEVVGKTSKDIELADASGVQQGELPTKFVEAPIESDVAKEIRLPETPLEMSTDSAIQSATFVEEDMPKGLNAKKRKEWKKKQDKAREAFGAEQLANKTAMVETESEPEGVKEVMKTGSVPETPSEEAVTSAEVAKEIEVVGQSHVVEEVVNEAPVVEALPEIPQESEAMVDNLEPSIARSIALPDSSGAATPIESTEAEAEAGGKKKKKKKDKKTLLPWEDEPTSAPSGEMTADEMQAKIDAEKAAQSETVTEKIPARSEPVADLPVLESTPEIEASRDLPSEPIIEEVSQPISDIGIEIPLPESNLAIPLETTEAESSSTLESASSKKSKKKKKGKQAVFWEEEPVSPAPEVQAEFEVIEEVIEPMSKETAAQVAQQRVVVQPAEPPDEDYVNKPSEDTVWIEDKEKDGEGEQVETSGDVVMEELSSNPLPAEEVAKDIPLPDTPMETATESSGLDSGLSRKASKKKKKGKKGAASESEPVTPLPEQSEETPNEIEIVDAPGEKHIKVPTEEHVTISEPVLHDTVIEVDHPSTPPNAEHVDVAVDIQEQPSTIIDPIAEPASEQVSGTGSGTDTPFVSVSINEDSDRTPSDKTPDPEEPIENTEQPKTAFLEHSASGKGSISQLKEVEEKALVSKTGAGGVGNSGEAETPVDAEQKFGSESGGVEQGKGMGKDVEGPLAGEDEVMPKGLNKKQKKAWEKAADKRRVERELAAEDAKRLANAASAEIEEIVEQLVAENVETPREDVEPEAEKAREIAEEPQAVLEDLSPEPVIVQPLADVPAESDGMVDNLETSIARNIALPDSGTATGVDSTEAEEEDIMPKGLNKKQKKAWEKAAEKRRVETELAAEDAKRLPEAAENEVEQIVEEPVVVGAEMSIEVEVEQEKPKMERKLSKKEQKTLDKKRREEEEEAEAKRLQEIAEDDTKPETPADPITPAEQRSPDIVDEPPMETVQTIQETAIEDEWAPTRKLSKKEKKALDKKRKEADEQALLMAATAAVTAGAAAAAVELLTKDDPPVSKAREVEESAPMTPIVEAIPVETFVAAEGVKDTPLQVTSRDSMDDPSTESRTDSESPPANTKAKRRDKGKGKAIEPIDSSSDKGSIFTPIDTTHDLDEQDRSSRAGNDTQVTAIFHTRSSSPPSGSGIFQQALEKVVEKQVQQRDLQENITKEAVKGSWSFTSLADEDKPDTPWSASRLPPVLEEEQPITPTSPTRARSPVHRGQPHEDSGYVPSADSPKSRPRSWFDPEYVRDSGVQLREKRSSDSQRSLKDLANTDDVLARRSWPPVNEERETVDLRRKKRSSLKESQSSPYEKITPGDIAKAATGLGIASGHKRSLSKSPALSESPSREFLLRKANRSHTPASEEKGNSSSTSSRQPSALRELGRGETPRSASDRQHSRQNSLLESLHHDRTDSPRSFSDQIHNPRTRTPKTPQEREDYYNRGATPTLSERGLGSSLSRPGSVISNRSVTPSLRRVSGRASSDLRALSQSDLKAQQSTQSRVSSGAKDLTDSGSASDAADKKPSPTISDNLDKRDSINNSTSDLDKGPPNANEGRQRVKGMAEVYNGFGEGRMGSPRSPTRPHSMRRKQSMQLLDMQAQMAAMAEELAAARQEKAVILQAKEAAERNLDQARREASKAGQYQAQAEEVRGLLESMTLKNTDLTRQTLDLQAQLELRDNGADEAIAAAVAAAIASKETEIQALRARAERLSHDWSGDEREIEELEAIISAQKTEIATLRQSQSTSTAAASALGTSGAPDYLADFQKSDAYFEQSCQKLFRGVWRWIHAFSDRRRNTSISLDSIKSLPDQRIYSWLKDAFAGNPSTYLADIEKRRLILMSLTMALFHHYIFSKHFFGLDSTQEEASRVLEMIVDDSEISDSEFRTWRATQFCLFSKSRSYTSQRNSEVLAVTQSVLHKLSSVLPQPSNSASDEQRTKILIGELQIIVKKAAELSNDMRRQRSKYIWRQSEKAVWGAPRSKAPERFVAGSMTHAEICVQFMELHRVDEKLGDANISAEVREGLNRERAQHLGTLVRDFHVISEDEAMVPGFRLSWDEMLRRMEEKNRRIEEKGMGVRLTLFPMVVREGDESGEGKQKQIIWKAVVKPVDLKIPTPGGKRRTSDMGSVAGGSEHGSKHARVR